MKPYRVIKCATREEWLEARRSIGVGASEVACLFSRPGEPLRGLSNWDSPYSLSLKKRGIIEPRERDEEEAEHLEWSGYIEPSIAGWFAAKVMPEIDFTLRMVNLSAEGFTLLADGESPLVASLDRLLVNDAGEWTAVAELKNASLFMADEWGTEPPLVYTIQVQAQLAVTGLQTGYLVVSFGGRPPKWCRIDRDEAMIAIIRKRVTEFWASVEANEDPPVDAANETARALLARWPQDDGATVQLGEEHLAKWEERLALAAEKKRVETVYDLRTNELKQAIGEASYGQLPEGRVLSLRANKAGQRNLKEVKS